MAIRCNVASGVPDGIRTRVTAVKGRCPGPLDDGDARGEWTAGPPYPEPDRARKITRAAPGGQCIRERPGASARGLHAERGGAAVHRGVTVSGRWARGQARQ